MIYSSAVFLYFCSGVHLKDLILLHTALPDRVEGNLINFRKMAQLSVILRELTKLQTHDAIPGVFANMDLINTLRVCKNGVKRFVYYHIDPTFSDRYTWANSADPDQTVPRGAV